MERDKEWRDELKDFSIGESGKRNHQAPEGYFDQLPDKVLQRWHQEKEQPVARFIGLRKMIAAAAVVSGICIGITLLTKPPSDIADIPIITSSDAYLYILENINDFAPLLLESGQQAEATQPETKEQTDPAVLESHEIEEYLLEEMENEDFETLF